MLSEVQSREALRRAFGTESLALVTAPTPLEEMSRLRLALGGGPRLLVKRDDTIPFAFGGNKVRKMELVAAQARWLEADTLVTVGGVQSNHARVTAATAVRLGIRSLLLINGRRPDSLRANALLEDMMGATIEYIGSREERAPAITSAIERLERAGRRPFVVPLGASTPSGALGYVRAIAELLGQGPAPDVIIHAASSGGTSAGLSVGCALHGLATRVIGISADDSSSDVLAQVRTIVSGMSQDLGCEDKLLAACRVEIDDSFVGDGYGCATPASCEAQSLAAQTEALFVDHTYTAKALAAVIAHVRAERLQRDTTVLFWHTGGQIGLFA